MNLIGKKVILRAMELEDMELFREMTNDPNMERLIAGWSFPISKQQQLDWYNRVYNDNKSLRFTVVLKENNSVVGMVNLVDIDWKNGTAMHGIRLSDDAPKNQGIGTDAVMTLMRYAFEELRLHRLNGGRIEDNYASEKLYKKCGWVDEGIQRESIFCEGKYHDYISVGILAQEYFEKKKELGY